MRKGYLSINQDIIATNSLSKDVKNAALVATLAKKITKNCDYQPIQKAMLSNKIQK